MVKVYFDGAYRPKSNGISSAGVRIIADGKVLLSRGFYLGCGLGCTSNTAEYGGLIKALEYLCTSGYTSDIITIAGDSKLVIMQMQGKWRIKKGVYREKALQAKELVSRFSSVSFDLIPRDQNSHCDSLAETIIEEALKGTIMGTGNGNKTEVASLLHYCDNQDMYTRRCDPYNLNWGEPMDADELVQAGFRDNRVPIKGDWDYKVTA